MPDPRALGGSLHLRPRPLQHSRWKPTVWVCSLSLLLRIVPAACRLIGPSFVPRMDLLGRAAAGPAVPGDSLCQAEMGLHRGWEVLPSGLDFPVKARLSKHCLLS